MEYCLKSKMFISMSLIRAHSLATITVSTLASQPCQASKIDRCRLLNSSHIYTTKTQNTKPSSFQFLGILLSILGVIFIILKGNIINLFYLNFTPGDIWMLIAVICWGLYSVLLKRLDSSLPQIPTLSVMIFFGLIFIFPFYFYESLSGSFYPNKQSDFFMIFYVAIFAGIFSFIFWNKGVSIIGANRAGVFLHLIPLFS